MRKEHIVEKVGDFQRRKDKYHPVATFLEAIYGRFQWETGQSAMDELISCILSQSTTDANRDRGFFALKACYPTWESAHHAPTDELINTIRPAGLANQKGPRIQNVLGRIYAERGTYEIDFLNDMPIEEAKEWLISLEGVGPKTAAIVLCFAFNRAAFPVDTHIYRVGQRIGFIPPKMNADNAHLLMEAIAPPEDYYPFHLQMIWHGRKVCQARRPQCEICPLTDLCDYYSDIHSNNTSKKYE